MNFSDAVINVLLQEEHEHGPGAGMTRRELERLGVSFRLTRNEARMVLNRLEAARVIVSQKKIIDGEKQRIWTANRRKLIPVGP